MKYMLGIDLGTSSVKALLLDTNGNVAETTRVEYDINISGKGYAEQDPKVWKESAFNVIRELLLKSKVDSADIEAVGLSGQMHGLVLMNKNNEVLRPAIIWSDQRTVRQVRYINNSIGKAKLGEYTSNPMATGFYAVSLMWVKENQPHFYNDTKVAILPKDYLRYELTGNIGTEITDASGTGLFDVSMAKWNYSLMEVLELRKNILPECFKSYEIAGEILPEVAQITGLKTGTLVVFGGSDHSMQALGTGITKTGLLSINIGTGGQIYTPTQISKYDKQLRMHKFCQAVPGVWNIIGATLGAGLSLKQFVNNILKLNNFDLTDQVAIDSVAGSDGIIYVPYIAGERTPHMDPEASGMFFGLSLKNKQCDMVRAVMEGVAFSFRECFEIFTQMGLKTNQLVISGGGASNRLWRQIIADVFECKVYSSQPNHDATFGAAMLAGVGAGIFNCFDDAVEKCVKLSSDIAYPNDTNFLVYRRNFEIFKELYNCSKHLNKM